MRIRWKLLILLLVIALLPLIVSNVIGRLSTYKLGDHLASQTREVLVAQAEYRLQRLVDNYGRVLDRDREALEFALRVQAREVQRRLAEPPVDSPRVFFAQDYDREPDRPDGMVLSEKHFQATSTGELSPIAVNYGEQVYLLPAGLDRQAVADDVARLSMMPNAYRFLYESNPELMYWQYASLESGLHTSYPGHGGYPPHYDPRQRRWYRAAKQAAALVWLPPMVDASTGTITLALAMPLRRADGSFAGVTAIDVPLAAACGSPGLWTEAPRKPGRVPSGCTAAGTSSAGGPAWPVKRGLVQEAPSVAKRLHGLGVLTPRRSLGRPCAKVSLPTFTALEVPTLHTAANAAETRTEHGRLHYAQRGG